MWRLLNEHEQQLDKKEKNAKVRNTYFFLRKKFISKDIKANNYKMKNFNMFVPSFKGNP